MAYQDLLYFLQNVGKDPSRLIFEDELTGIYNRRFLLNYFEYKIPWDSLDTHPVSLIMLDIDYFKQINDTHGHEAGDQALVWMATLLREVSGDTGLPIRYAGDEFIILLPKVEKQAALQIGESLLELIHEKPVKLEGKTDEFPLTLSVGVASAPDDAKSGKDLVQKADTALYFSKKTGRDRLSNASLVTPHEVSDKTALYQLDQANIAGRQTQLATVAEALKRFSEGQSQFLIVEGAAGLGKSELLDTIQKNVSKSEDWQIKVKGVPQELFRPYYLTTNILIETFNRMPDKGVKIFESLNPKEIYYLSHILPQLGESKDYSKDSEKAQREGLFTTLIHFIPKVLDSRPAILLVDDLHFADEATLLLLRRLLLDKVFPLFICATATDTRHDKSEGDPSPLERFYSAYCKDLDIHKVSLTPLTAAHIAEHLRGVFPQLDLPQNFENNLARITQGNPLFLNEIVRKLVMDRKINLVGNQWVIETLAEDYLPESLEQIVSEKIAALDEESRSLLDQASTFGENVSLSMLSGSSEEMEAKVLEFLDQAVDQGLLSSEFQINDETIRFLSKRVLDIAYGAIEEERKQELHERVGSYQEVLFEQHLIPSAATLAYHFKRSTNEEKTGNYEKLQASSNHRLFDATEAVSYSAERATEAAPETSPLNKDSLPLIPAAIRSMLLVVRNLKLYPPGSKAIVSANRQMKEVIDQFLEKNELLSLYSIKNALIVNGQKIDVAEYKYFAESFLKLLSRFELKGITFKKGLTGQELQILLEAFCRVKNDMIDQHFWQRFLGEQRIVNIELTQVRYTVITDSAGQAQTAQFAAGEDGVAAVDIAAQLEDAEQGMDEHDIRELPEIIRTLLNAARSEQSKLLGKILLRPLEPKAQQLILEDFRSGDAARRQNAAQLLGSARRASLPLLIKLIKREEEFRVRQMAASLLSEYGTQAAKLLKRELALQTTPEEKVRILEILDTVTHDLRTQLAYALADDSDQVRQAALQLAERLNDDQAGKLLLEQTENENVQVAIAAIKFLGKLKPPAANEKLVSILQTAKNEQLVVACCQSLGLIGDPASIDPLAKLLVSKGFFRRKRQSAEVRATAALALSQIDHPRVIQILSSHADDNDPRVRQIANSVIQPTSTHPNGKLATAK